MKLILASASIRRAEILRDAGLSFTVMSSAVDETPFPGEAADGLVDRRAVAKAELVAARATGPAIVIGADTEVTLEGRIFGKPRSSDDARHMLERLSGRTHAVLTGEDGVRAARKAFQHVASVIGRARLAEDAAFEGDFSVGADDDGRARGAGGNQFGFGDGPTVNQAVGSLARE